MFELDAVSVLYGLGVGLVMGILIMVFPVLYDDYEVEMKCKKKTRT